MPSFLNLFIFTDASHVSGGSSAHHQEQISVRAASGIATVEEMLHLAGSSSFGWQYLKLHVQIFAPDDGRRNRLKHVERL